MAYGNFMNRSTKGGQWALWPRYSLLSYRECRNFSFLIDELFNYLSHNYPHFLCRPNAESSSNTCDYTSWQNLHRHRLHLANRKGKIFGMMSNPLGLFCVVRYFLGLKASLRLYNTIEIYASATTPSFGPRPLPQLCFPQQVFFSLFLSFPPERNPNLFQTFHQKAVIQQHHFSFFYCWMLEFL